MSKTNRPAIVLVGPMGAGKSTVGKQLAAILDREFIDTDAELEARCGADIPWIFDIEGEEGFRRRETEVLSDLVKRPDVVLATGGGAVLSPENRKLMATHATVVYLTAPIDALFQRVSRDKTRPLLQVENPRETYGRIFQQRDPLYREIADHIILTDNETSPVKVGRIIYNQMGFSD